MDEGTNNLNVTLGGQEWKVTVDGGTNNLNVTLGGRNGRSLRMRELTI